MSDKDKEKKSRPFGSLGQRLFGLSRSSKETKAEESANVSGMATLDAWAIAHLNITNLSQANATSGASRDNSHTSARPTVSLPPQREDQSSEERTSPSARSSITITDALRAPTAFAPLSRLNPLGSNSSRTASNASGLLDRLEINQGTTNTSRRLQGLSGAGGAEGSPFVSGNLDSPMNERASGGGRNSGIFRPRVVVPEDFIDCQTERTSNTAMSRAGTLSCMKNTPSVAGGRPFTANSGNLDSDFVIVDEPTTPFNRDLVALTQQIQEVQQRQQQLGQLIHQRRGLTDNGSSSIGDAGMHGRHHSQQLPVVNSPQDSGPSSIQQSAANSMALPTFSPPSLPLSKLPSFNHRGVSSHLAGLRQPSIKEEETPPHSNDDTKDETSPSPPPAPPPLSASAIAAAAAARVASTNAQRKGITEHLNDSKASPPPPSTAASNPSPLSAESKPSPLKPRPEVIAVPSVPPPRPPPPPPLSRTTARDLLGALIDDMHTISLPGYTVGSQIGEGGFSTVLLGIHNITKRKVAIKVVERSRLTDPLDEKNMRREMRVMRHLNGHDAVVRMYEVIETRERIYLVLEFAPCDSLLNFVRTHRKMGERDAAHALQQLASGLDFCHSREVVHRDIKLENIMMPKDERGSMKLIDFGLAAFFVPGKRLRANCGSPSYAAPEIVACREYDGPPVDVWSLGVVLFAMLSGYLPFHASGGNRKDLCKKILDGKYAAPDNLSPAAKDIIARYPPSLFFPYSTDDSPSHFPCRMLTVDPNLRITLPEVLSHPWIKSNPWIKPQVPGGLGDLGLSTYQVRVDLHRGLVYAGESTTLFLLMPFPSLPLPSPPIIVPI